MILETKNQRVDRIAKILRASFAHVAPRETLTVPNEHWKALVWSTYRASMSDEQIAESALDAVFKGER